MSFASVPFDAVDALVRDVAQREILPRFKNLHTGDVSFKTGDDPVTVADQAAEASLSRALTALLPGSVVVGEEAVAADARVLERLREDNPVWIIDPIDGTRNFVAGIPKFGVLVALVHNNVALQGWIYDPSTDEVIHAERGAGAFFKGVRLRVLPPAPLTEMRGVIQHLNERGDATVHQKGIGSPHLDHPDRSVAHEFPNLVVDAPHFARSGVTPQSRWHFLGITNYCTPWDHTACVLVHQEAGGYTALLSGEPFTPSSYRQGILSAPDQESWRALQAWIAEYRG